MRIALVVPTVRASCLSSCLEAWSWRDKFDELIVVEDAPEKTFDYDIKHHYSWNEIDIDLGKDAWIISRRDSSIRSYGFIIANRLNVDYIFTIDDDCYPINKHEFIDLHIKNLTNTPKWVESVPNQRTRGLPYFNKGVNKNVVMSVGLWKGIPDFDSIQTLSGENQQILLPETRVLPSGQYSPICGMNLCIKKEFVAACYFPLQGESNLFRRFDDIWMGIIAKKIADHLRLSITQGKPYICHKRASDPMVNLVKEAPGIKFNEIFWEIIDDIELSGNSPLECMIQIGKSLLKAKDEYGYCEKLGYAIDIWCRLITPNQ